jgi:polyisoprenoid-binding protein YceI
METSGLWGFLAAEVAGGEVRLQPAASVELEVQQLKSNNSLLDSELQRRLEVRKYPRIKGDLRQVKPLGENKWLLEGDLSLHGVKQPMEVEVTVDAHDGTLELAGEKVIDMRDFGLQPPKLLFLRVDPQVRIRALLVAKQS